MSDTAVGALIGVFGALAGGGLSWWAGWWTEKRRWEREDARRFHDRRLETYAEFLNVSARIFSAFAQARALDGAFLSELDRFHSARGVIAFIASDAVVASASSIVASVQRFLDESPGHDEATRRADHLIRDFVRCCREELGTKSPNANWMPTGASS